MVGFVGFIEYKGNPSYKNNNNKQKNFLIRESCFWCASSASISTHYMINSEKISKCPPCDNDRIRVIPILIGLHV
jgi:hypothetical protein